MTCMQKVVEGILTNYEIVGKGKKNLLILHGWKGSLGDWMQVAKGLEKNYRVILLDLPGFGGSGKPAEDWGIYEYGEFAKKFLDTLGIKKTVVMGHSFGGRVGILLAARTSLVERLILVDAAGMETKSLKTKVIKMAKPFVGWLPQEIKNRMGSRNYRDAGDMRKTFVKVVNQPLREELKKIHSPTLIIWGEKDRELSLGEAAMLKDGIAGSKLRIVWGANHFPHLHKYDDFMRILEEENV